MNTRTANESHSKFPIPHLASRVDEQLAFIDRVCELLIESRFGPGRSNFIQSGSAGFDRDLMTFECSSCASQVHPLILTKVVSDIESICDEEFQLPQSAGPAILPRMCTSQAVSDLASEVRAMSSVYSSVRPARARGSPAYPVRAP